MRPHLNELQWRLLLAAQARSLGRGGIKRVAALTGVHPDTVAVGARTAGRALACWQGPPGWGGAAPGGGGGPGPRAALDRSGGSGYPR